jgi:hypothetical protein
MRGLLSYGRIEEIGRSSTCMVGHLVAMLFRYSDGGVTLGPDRSPVQTLVSQQKRPREDAAPHGLLCWLVSPAGIGRPCHRGFGIDGTQLCGGEKDDSGTHRRIVTSVDMPALLLAVAEPPAMPK